MSQIEYSDRYSALGVEPPDSETMCKGPCEGLGVYPESDDTPAWRAAHNKPDAHADGPCDGYHFVKCEDCNGTGMRQR